MVTVFPGPWTISEATGEFIVADAGGRVLAHFYWWGDGTPAFLTRDQARFLAEKFIELPSISRQQREDELSLTRRKT
jgi:hypothetical protein